jgi:succinoglycan biosynthesis transport protein ExoP
MAETDDDRQEGLPDWIRDPMGVARRRWRGMLAAFVLGLVATGVAAALREPVYVARAMVLLADQKLTEALVKPATSSSPVDAGDAFAAEALSETNLTKVVDDLGLFPDLRKSMKPQEIVAVMRESIKIDSRDPATPRPPPGIRSGDRSRVMRIGYEANDPVLAATVANRLASLFQTEGLRVRGEQARLASEFMRREVATAEAALRDQKARIAEFEEKHRGELPSDLDANRRRVERLQDQRDDLMRASAEAQTRLAQVVDDSGRGGSGTSKLAEAKAALAQARSVMTDTHPNVIALRRRVEELEKSGGGGGGGGGGGNVAAAARNEVAQYRDQIAATDAELDALDQKIARTPGHEAEITALQQRAKSLEEAYFDVLQKLTDAELAESLELSQQGSQIAVLEQAAPPRTPEKGRIKIVFAGLLASIGLSALLALALELRDPVIATAQGVESLAGVPVLGVMPRVS